MFQMYVALDKTEYFGKVSASPLLAAARVRFNSFRRQHRGISISLFPVSRASPRGVRKLRDSWPFAPVLHPCIDSRILGSWSSALLRRRIRAGLPTGSSSTRQTTL